MFQPLVNRYSINAVDVDKAFDDVLISTGFFMVILMTIISMKMLKRQFEYLTDLIDGMREFSTLSTFNRTLSAYLEYSIQVQGILIKN
ncbi:MAG: hypothetical protein LBN01_02055 [Endomicrobium sp.]|jgi:hypothetical protein|nr:hypothetical protein [Endomicrobium sp.]